MTNTNSSTTVFGQPSQRARPPRLQGLGHHQRHAVLALGLEAQRRGQAVADLSVEAGDGNTNDKAF
jgi:hypothetical protein